MADSQTEAVTLEQYGELEVRVIKLRRALAHAQSVTKRQDAALSKTIDRLQTLDEEVKELKKEGCRLEDEILNIEDDLERRRNSPEMSQKDAAEKQLAEARAEIEEIAFERCKVRVEIEKQKLCNREISKTIEIVRQRYEHEGKKRRHEIRKLDEREIALRKEIETLKLEKVKLLGGNRRGSGTKERTQMTTLDRKPAEASRTSRESVSTTTNKSATSSLPMASNAQQISTEFHTNSSWQSSEEERSSDDDAESFG
jgi:hypothetical protein